MPPPLPIALPVNIAAQIEGHARNLQQVQQTVFSTRYFEVRGDLVVFKNTNEMFNHVRSLLKKADEMAKSAISTLNQYASKIRAMDDRTVFTYVMVNFLGLRANDPQVLQTLALFAGPPGSRGSRHISRAIDETIRNVISEIEKKRGSLGEIQGKLPGRFSAWVGLDNNAFNWKTQKFQAASKWNVGGRLANYASLNSMVRDSKSDALNSIFSAGLSRAGLPGPAVEPTAKMLAGIIMGDAKA